MTRTRPVPGSTSAVAAAPAAHAGAVHRDVRAPRATYRLQFNAAFPFDAARELVDYLAALGVGDVYASPIFAARQGSLHGYDVVDTRRVNPELGDLAGLRSLAVALREQDMGLVLDIVPNHMCVADVANTWWQDVLENGPASQYAAYFDIDWHPPKPDLAYKVLLPMLGDQYGRVIESPDLRVTRQDGSFRLEYATFSLPLAPRSWSFILEPASVRLQAVLGEEHAHAIELESILTAIAHLPERTATDDQALRVRRREKEVIRRRLTTLLAVSDEARQACDASVTALNSRAGGELQRLEALLDAQAYRLSSWRVASDEINYRRFFDTNDLAAVRIEEPEVFEAVHALPFQLVRDGLVTAFRIDHVDGLREPGAYLERLQRELAGDQPFPVLVEKILVGRERLPATWPVLGTTGYDAMGLLDRVFVDGAGARRIVVAYESFTASGRRFPDVAYFSRRLVLDTSLSAELTALARRLDRISEQHRYSRDFTYRSLANALREVIACFPVYRTYTDSSTTEIAEADRAVVEAALLAARRRNPATSASLFHFIGQILRLQHPEDLAPEHQADRRDFVLRFQQRTATAMAKGVEDTAFYRWYPLAALAEVGGEPDAFAVSLTSFHAANAERLAHWPGSLIATSTHDTKRGEDVRGRIRVLSEVPDEWAAALGRWRGLNRGHKHAFDGGEAPGADDEYLLYQTLVGMWPAEPIDEPTRAALEARVQGYMEKALREAKRRTSWIDPDTEYEAAVRAFISAVLSPAPENAFLPDLRAFNARVLAPALWSLLSQVVLKCTMPGVPDFYQGTEVWDYTLVDPDNRRPVDYAYRRRLLAELDGLRAGAIPGALSGLVRRPWDPRLKLWVTSRCLRWRTSHDALCRGGTYQPLSARGARAEHLVAYARTRGSEEAVVLAGRFFAQYSVDEPPVGDAWRDVVVPVETPAREYRDVLTGRRVAVVAGSEGRGIALSDAFRILPVALLEGVA